MIRIQQPRPDDRLSPELLHDLRTPLNHIIGYSELLKEQATEGGQLSYLTDLEKIHTAGKQLLSMLNREESPQPAVETPFPNGKIAIPDFDAGESMILVVDDSEANRDLLSRRLEQQGHTTRMAADGREAMEIVRRQDFDLVMLDIMMPEMDGFEVLRQLKADPLLRHIPVLMISALDDLESVVRCIEMGADDFLPKPFDPTLLKARTTACLQKKHAHDQETELFKRLEHSYVRLKELEGQRDNLMSMIVHDLRSPLGSIISGLRMVPTMGELTPRQNEVMDIALKGGESLLQMINSLLDVDKLESGAMVLDYSLLDAGALVGGAIDQIAQLADSGELTIRREIHPDVPSFEGDEETLQRALVNLLGNAVKFTPPGGSVVVSVRSTRDRQGLRFSVRDTGEGIPEEAFQRIFDKFGQVNPQHSRRLMGTGLGLAFCRLVVEAHGGHIGVESAPNSGSTFYFTIPIKGPTEGGPVLAL